MTEGLPASAEFDQEQPKERKFDERGYEIVSSIDFSEMQIGDEVELRAGGGKNAEEIQITVKDIIRDGKNTKGREVKKREGIHVTGNTIHGGFPPSFRARIVGSQEYIQGKAVVLPQLKIGVHADVRDVYAVGENIVDPLGVPMSGKSVKVVGAMSSGQINSLKIKRKENR